MTYAAGRHFLQIPGPSNVPERVLRAIDMPVIDHRGPEFAQLGKDVLAGMKRVFKTKGDVVIYPASGTGAWEAALVNTLSPGDTVLMYETGQFATLWQNLALRLGLKPEFIAGDWRHGADPAADRSPARRGHRAHHQGGVRRAQRNLHRHDLAHRRSAQGHRPRQTSRAVHGRHHLGAGLGRLPSRRMGRRRHRRRLAEGPDAAAGAVVQCHFGKSARRQQDRETAALVLVLGRNARPNKNGFFPYTPATNLLYGLREALKMLLDEEGLDNVFARHQRHAEATRRAVNAWGLEILCQNPAEYSGVLTAVLMPAGHSEVAFRKVVLEHFNMSLGSGLGKIADKVFRIGHLGDFNDLTLMGTLAGVEMGLELAGVPHQKGGVDAAMAYLTSGAAQARAAKAA